MLLNRTEEVICRKMDGPGDHSLISQTQKVKYHISSHSGLEINNTDVKAGAGKKASPGVAIAAKSEALSSGSGI